MNPIKIKTAFLLVFLTLVTAFSTQALAIRHNQNQILDEIQYQIDIHNWNEAKQIITFFQNSDADKGTFIAYQIDKFDIFVSEILRDEKPLFDQLKVNFNIHKANDYLDQYPYGLYYDQVTQLIHSQNEESAWKLANSNNTYNSYNRYLSIYPNGIYTSQAKQQLILLEDSEYQNAINNNTPNALKGFLSRYPNSQYRNDVEQRLEKISQEYEYNKAIKYNSISAYEEFLIKYPDGPYSEEINNRLKNEYLDSGDYAFAGKNYLIAKQNYENFLRLNNDPTLEKKIQAKLEISKKYAHRTGGSVSMFTMDTNQTAGYTFAQLDTAIPGFYVSVKIKPEVIDVDPFDTINDQGFYSGTNPGTATGSVKNTSFAFSTGMTYQFKYPIWAYMGAGFEFRSQYEEVETTDIFDDPEYVWVENVDQNRVFITPELGFILKQNNFVLNYGIRYTDELIHQFGLGMVY